MNRFELAVDGNKVVVRATSNSSSITFSNTKDINVTVEKSTKAPNKTFSLTTGKGNDTIIIAEGAKAIKSAKKVIEPLLKGIKGVDDTSIINACKLVSFDVWARNPDRAKSLPCTLTNPDKATVQNIQTMVKRSMNFLKNTVRLLKMPSGLTPCPSASKMMTVLFRTD